MTDNFKGIVSTIRDTNRTIYPASYITQRRPRIVRTAPMNMRNGQRTDTSGASPSVQRTSTLLPISPTLSKQVTPAVEAEGPASCLTTQPDTANTYIDADAANVTGHKMDANASVIFAPSSTSSSQDNTRNHASQVNVSRESAGQIITRRRRRVNRTVRRISEDQAREQTVDWHYSSPPCMIVCGRRRAYRTPIWNDRLWNEWEEDEDEGYSSI